MNKVFDFIKSLFVPKKMDRFRKMSLIISIIIFVLIVYLLLLPINFYFKHNVTKLVDKENLDYLQVLSKFPTAGDELGGFIERIKEKEISLVNDDLVASNLGAKHAKVTPSGNLIGMIDYNYDKNSWVYEDNNQVVTATSNVSSLPSVVTLEDGFVINQITTDKINYDGITQDEKIDVIRVYLNDRSRVVIGENGQVYHFIGTSTISFSERENKLVINDILTDYTLINKTIIYYVFNGSVTYYEDTFSYVADDGYTKIINFSIDLSSNYIQEFNFNYNKDTGYPGNTETDEFYYLVMFKKSFYYQAHQTGVVDANIKHGDKVLESSALTGVYDKKISDFTDLDKSNFGIIFLNNIKASYITNVNSQYALVFVFDAIVMPLLLSFIFFLMFKKNGRMKRFREYYAVSSIASVAPALITFGLTWFFPQISSYTFILGFGVWFLLVCYKINSIHDDTN